MFKLQPFKLFGKSRGTEIYKFIKKVPLSVLAFMLLVAMFINPHEAKAVECDGSVPISAGYLHTVGMKEDGTVVAAGGYNKYGQTNVSDWTSIKAVSAGYWHTVGLREDGSVVAVGHNGYGQTNVSDWTGIKAISAGLDHHTVGLREDGSVVAVGNNKYGQTNVSDWTSIKAVSAGRWHTVGLREDGSVVAVGINWWGQANVSDWTGIKAISAGSYQTVGLRENGSVVAVGLSGNVSGWTDIGGACDSAPSTPEEVGATIEDMFTNGEITDAGTVNALMASLDNAERNLETSPVSGENMLEATIKKIEAQAGKKISADAAEKLIGYLTAIIEAL